MGQKLLFSCLFSFLCSAALWSQKQNPIDVVLRHLEENHEAMHLTSDDYADMELNYSYTSKLSGATYMYFNQTYNGIKVKNAIMNYTIKNGEVIHVGNKFVPELQSKVVAGQRSRIDAGYAVVNAAKHIGVLKAEAPHKLRSNDASGDVVFAPTSYTRSEIKVEPTYAVGQDGKYHLTWQATMEMKGSADYWEIRMDASTGDFVSKNNLTVYCSHHADKYKRHENCGVTSYLNTQSNSVKVSEMLQNASAYRVYPLPAESPNHGAHELVTDPHFVAASPYGWHDTDGVDGPEHTITRGNNVYAYTDKDDDNNPDEDVVLPDGGAALTFDFEHNRGVEPLQNADAALTNLFYTNNMIHDISFLMGFDEESGNFQQRNYSGRGLGNDYVLAQAFDGFELTTPSLNNANFSTPADGNNGRMQMFLWTSPEGAVSVDAPSDLVGFYEYGTADYGNPVPGVNEDPITGVVELVTDGDPQNPSTGCKEIENDLSGKIALIDRGLCFFSEKSFNAQTKGAIGVIICNIAGVNGGDGETVFGMAGSTNANLVTIPTVSFKKSDCDKIKLALSNDVEVVVTMHERERTGPEFVDGAFDNGVILHEFAHGISNRLTGGPTAAGCLGNDEQMGEGWSDFFSLIATVRPGDKGEDARGIGTFAVSEPIDGRGIRRFPYSTDMSINPQTFDDIKGTTAPHPLGEVWVACLWDMYWAMVDVYGWDADWNNLESGNAKAVRLVMEGMKIQPCNPGFIEGRDAILAADRLLYDGENTCLIWDAFARRGVGYFADGGSSDDRNDGIENYEALPTCLEALKIKKTATSFITAGDEIEVTLVATNHIPMTLNGVIVTDEIPDGLTFVENSSSLPGTIANGVISFDLGTMAYEDEVFITYKVKSSSSMKSATLSFYDFEENSDLWTVNQIEGFNTWTINFEAYKSFETSYYIREAEEENDHGLVSPVYNISGERPALKFWHRYDTEPGVDGGFVQISTDNGNTWKFTKQEDFLRGGYNTPIEYGTLAIPSLEGFTGTTNQQFVDSYLDLSEYKGMDILVRFRFGTNETGVSSADYPGWFIDDVELVDVFTYEAKACINDDTNMHGSCAEPNLTFVDSDGLVNAKDVDVDYFGMKLSPNPADNYVRLFATSPVTEKANLTITSVDGRVIHSEVIGVSPVERITTINTTGMTPGIYMVTLQTGTISNTHKLIVY